MLRKQLISIITMFASMSLLSACASQPTQVKADIPLVHPNYQKSLVSQSDSLGVAAKFIPSEGLIADQQVQLGTQRFRVGKSYLSALGAKCHKLYPMKDGIQLMSPPRSVCLSDSEWTALEPLVSSLVSTGETNKQ